MTSLVSASTSRVILGILTAHSLRVHDSKPDQLLKPKETPKKKNNLNMSDDLLLIGTPRFPSSIDLPLGRHGAIIAVPGCQTASGCSR